MTLGDILKQAAQKDLSATHKTGLSYSELTINGKFEIKLSSPLDREAYIECSVPDKGMDEEKNYLRMYFLSMVYNAAIHGMKRLKQTKKNKK